MSLEGTLHIQPYQILIVYFHKGCSENDPIAKHTILTLQVSSSNVFSTLGISLGGAFHIQPPANLDLFFIKCESCFRILSEVLMDAFV